MSLPANLSEEGPRAEVCAQEGTVVTDPEDPQRGLVRHLNDVSLARRRKAHDRRVDVGAVEPVDRA